MPKKSRAKARKRMQNATGRHPLHQQAVALMQPFKSPAGVAQHLIDALPSQKITLRSRGSINCNGNGSILGFVSPYLWNDSNYPSCFVFNNVTAGGADASNDAVLGSSTVSSYSYPSGWNGSLLMAPVRPYDAAGGDRSCRLVSYAIRIAYTGTALNANGRLKLLATPHGELNLAAGTSVAEIISTIQSSHHTQMKSIHDQAVYEFNFIGNDRWDASGAGAEQDVDTFVENVLGGVNSPRRAYEPGAAFYYLNTASTAISFEIEVIENWEVRGANLASFYTESHSDPIMHHEILNVINTAHTRAGLSTETKFSNVVTSVAKASRSPVGKALLAAALA